MSNFDKVVRAHAANKCCVLCRRACPFGSTAKRRAEKAVAEGEARARAQAVANKVHTSRGGHDGNAVDENAGDGDGDGDDGERVRNNERTHASQA